MKITSNPSNNVTKLYQTYQNQSEKTEKKAGSDAIEQDNLQLSEQAQKIHELITESKDLPDIREEKIAQIKSQIVNNTYSVTAQQLASKMLSSENQ